MWSTSPPEVDAPTLSIEARLFGHQGAITALAASMEYRVLVSAGTDRQVLYDKKLNMFIFLVSESIVFFVFSGTRERSP